jgi:subtilase family serine protease
MRTRHANIVSAIFLLIIFLYSNTQAQLLPYHAPRSIARSNLKPAGRLPASMQLNLFIGLPWRNQEALTNLLSDLYNPASPNFHHYLTPKQFAEQFGPATNDYETLIAFVQAHGLTVTRRHPNRMLLDVSAPVSKVEQTLHVRFLTYHHPTEKRDFFAPDATPIFNAPVQVLAVSGLDNFSLPSPCVHIETNAPQSGPVPYGGSGIGGTYRGYDFRDAYMPGVTLTGAGQSIGLFEMDGYHTNDITTYEQQASLPNVPLKNVFLNSITNNAVGANGLEVTLDIDMAVAMAPGISNVIVYEGTNTADILNRMATDDLANQLSSSWKPFDASLLTDQALQELAAQGQSMFQASGDSDAQPALDISEPSSPYETLVGGTVLTTSGGLGSWVSETTWNPGSGTGTGGGISAVYSIPDWQTNVSMAINGGSASYRNSPDVALTAKNVLVINNGLSLGVGGTSCAAPLWAGVAALVNQQAAQRRLPPVGFLNPAIYTIGLSPDYNSCFHDTTTGNNFSSGSPAEFSAESGYDLCTGWGTPAGQSLIDALTPSLIMTRSTSQLLISWPTIWTNAVLQQNFNLATANWAAVTNTVNVTSNLYQVTVTPSGTNNFFRIVPQ